MWRTPFPSDATYLSAFIPRYITTLSVWQGTLLHNLHTLPKLIPAREASLPYQLSRKLYRTIYRTFLARSTSKRRPTTATLNAFDSFDVSLGDGSFDASQVDGLEGLEAPKPRKKRNVATHNPDGTLKLCNYCKTNQTPMWRRGPDGPGTLCNACGSRWKMGRLETAARPPPPANGAATAVAPKLEISEQVVEAQPVVEEADGAKGGQGAAAENNPMDVDPSTDQLETVRT